MTTTADYPYDFRVALLTRTRRAWVVPALVAINIVVLAAMTVAGVDPWSPTGADVLEWGGSYAPYATAGQWWRLLTAMFVHGGALHLCMNMLVLLQIGPLVERLLGNRGFAVAYLVSGLVASVASIAWNPYAVSAGASGAIFGVFGVLVAYVLRYRGSIPADVARSLRKSAATFVVLNVALGLLVRRIDVAAHLAGFVAGACAGSFVVRPLDGGEGRPPLARELVLLAASLALVTGATALLPRAFDLRAEIAGFGAAEDTSLSPYTTAVQRRRANAISDADVARVIDEQVLPPLREHGKRLEGLSRLRGEQKQWVDRSLAYVAVRERAWSTLSEALRASDRGKAAEASALHSQADALASALRSLRRS